MSERERLIDLMLPERDKLRERHKDCEFHLAVNDATGVSFLARRISDKEIAGIGVKLGCPDLEFAVQCAVMALDKFIEGEREKRC